MCRTPLPSSASYNGIIAPPGYPNTRSAPSARKQRRTMSAPLSIHDLGRRRIAGIAGLLLLLREPRHHPAQPGPNFFNRVLLFFFAQRGKLATTLPIFLNPLASKTSILNAGQNLLHGGARLVAYNLLAARQVAILGSIGNGVPHASKSALVNKVYDQFHLMQALEVSDFRLIAGL